MASETGERPAGSEQTPDATAPGAEAQLGATLAAGVELFAALRRVGVALAALVAAEVRLLRASAGLVLLGTVALVAFVISLWACIVALGGWALLVATGSAGSALGILVVLHVLLICACGWWLRRVIRRASFPAARSELRTLGRQLRGDVARFQSASAVPAPNEQESGP